ncbi:MAG: hypothetical protein WED09_09395 [Homoserinimonas sp.]
MSTRFPGVFATLTVIMLIAPGCAASPELAPPPPPTSEAAEPVETPTPTPPPFVPDCYNIISDQTEETLSAEGFILIEEYENKLRVEQRVEALFFDNGGVDCLWGIAGGGDSLVAFGYSEITPADAVQAQDRLAAIGYTRTDEGGDIVLSTDPATDVMGVGDVFVFSDGQWYHSTTREAIAELRDNVDSQETPE